MTKKIVVIGAGQAAASFVAKLRTLDQESHVTIIGDETSYPYQRPPLSKKYLSGEMDAERLLLRPKSWYSENKVDVITDTRAEDIDVSQKQARLSSGDMLAYDQLVLTTGSAARKLPSALTGDASNVYTVRNLADVNAMRAEFQKGRKLVVIGGGYIGLEAAAVARKFGVEVTLVEAAPRILGRVASELTADFIRKLHVNHDVRIVEGIGVQSMSHMDNKVSTINLDNGEALAADFVIVGIGIIPGSALAQDAGLDCDHGILVDENSRTSDADIFAAGDCTRFEYQGNLIRLESVQNAIDQAENAALSIAGQAEPYAPKPWFWSDQYDVTLQIAGLNMGYDDVILRQGASDASQSVWYYKGEQLISVDAMNEPRSYMIGKRIIEQRKSLPKDVAGDPSADLKSWM